MKKRGCNKGLNGSHFIYPLERKKNILKNSRAPFSALLTSRNYLFPLRAEKFYF